MPLCPFSIFQSYRPSATSPTSLSVWRCFISSKGCRYSALSQSHAPTVLRRQLGIFLMPIPFKTIQNRQTTPAVMSGLSVFRLKTSWTISRANGRCRCLVTLLWLRYHRFFGIGWLSRSLHSLRLVLFIALDFLVVFFIMVDSHSVVRHFVGIRTPDDYPRVQHDGAHIDNDMPSVKCVSLRRQSQRIYY